MFVRQCNDEIKHLLSNKHDVSWKDIENEVIQPILKAADDPNLSKEEKGQHM